MKKNEKQLFKNLCSFQNKKFDASLIDAATPEVLGHLFFNRMQAVAYGTLKKHGLLGKINREFRNSLSAAYNQNIEKNNSFFRCVQLVEKALSNCDCKYAMLKGAYLCKAYPEGYRTSNDIDLLVHPRDVTKIGNALLVAGFKQGNVRNGEFKPATRAEIVSSKMMRGETVPYVKEINLPEMQFLEIDINFSLDYKPGNTALLDKMLNNSSIAKIDDFSVKTLAEDDFFIHLCSHLYKEATTLPWVEMMRDMTMYKYCDIYMLLGDYDKEKTDALFVRAKEFGMEKTCAFAIIQTSKLFFLNNHYAVCIAQKILKDDETFLDRVYSPKDKKTYIYTEKDVFKRFLANDRKKLLVEVKQNGKT